MSSLTAFDKAVCELAIPVLDELGFQVKKECQWRFRAVSPEYELFIYLGRFGGYVQFYLRRLPATPGQEAERVDLQWALAVLAPDVPELKRWPRQFMLGGLLAGELRREIERKADLISGYLRDLLSGDPDLWHKVTDAARTEGGLAKRSEETREEYVKRLRIEADAAWLDCAHWTVKSRYEAIRRLSGGLDVAESLRLWWARRNTFDIGLFE